MTKTGSGGTNPSKRCEIFVPSALRTKAERLMGSGGYRSFQEYLLQSLREKIAQDTKEQARGSKI